MTAFSQWLVDHDPIVLVPRPSQVPLTDPLPTPRTARTRSELLVHANAFYHDPDTGHRPSKYLVRVITLLAIVPVLSLLLARRALFLEPQPRRSLRPHQASLELALWIVYVPITRMNELGGFKGILLPSSSPLFIAKQVRR